MQSVKQLKIFFSRQLGDAISGNRICRMILADQLCGCLAIDRSPEEI